MRRAVIAGTLCVCVCVHALLQAQQAGSNVGVLPVVTNASDPDAYLKGDAFLQRQLEPSIGVSTRNPQTLIAFFNDYRAVDVATDIAEGEGNPETTFTLLAWMKPLSRMLGRIVGIAPKERTTPSASVAEAWVGMSRSFDGGRTWTGGFLPGAPFDQSTASLASPVRGAAAATDPVVASGPCGQFYVAFIAFNRGSDSHVAVARYVDNNNHEGGDNVAYLGTTVIDNSVNASQGQFLDKPSIAVDVARGAAASGCAQNVYVAYSQFTGKSGNKFQSSIMVARSTDGGLTFTKQKISNSYPENQGTVIAVDPRPGTPTTTGGGTVYVIWRHFFDPDAMIAQKSTDYGATWLGKGARITADTMQKFDQPTLATTAVGPADLAFRSNAFPTATVTPTGLLVAAWQERVDISTDATKRGFPAAGGSPRIVLTTSGNGTTWSPRKAIDFSDRDVLGASVPPPAAGLGFLPHERASGPQVMPSLSTGGGKVMLAYYESRGLAQADTIAPADVTGAGNYISGLDRLMDVRAAVLNPATGALQGTAQVSRYPLKAWANKKFIDGVVVDELSDVLPVSAPCSPDFGSNFPPCVRHVNRVNVPHSAAGTSPFIGDYIYLTPAVQFIKDAAGWRWTTAADVPEAGFHVAFADNRNQIPPTQLPAGSTNDLDAYKVYAPPKGGGSCVNPGSRNTDVITSRISANLVVSAPTTYKQLGTIQRAFPLTVSNGTGTNKFYRLTITAGADNASFSQGDPSLDSGDVQLFPYSSGTRVVYVSPTATGLITIGVQEITAYAGTVIAGGLSGVATINADNSNPAVSFGDADTETHNPFVQNPFVQNPFVQNPFVQNSTAMNPFVQNTSPSNPFVQNPFVQNPFVQNAAPGDVVDTTWTVQNAGNTTSTYLASVNVDNAAAYVGNYAFQLIIWKQSSNGTLTACDPSGQGQAEILANIVQDPTQQNPFVQNPFVQNPFVQNPFVQNPFVQNATFAVAPADATQTAGNGSGLRLAGAPTPNDDGTTRQPRPQDEVKVTLRAFKINPNSPITFDPRISPPSLAVIAHSKNIVDSVLQDTPVGFTSPDLILSGGIGGSAGTKAAGSTFTFPSAGFSVFNQGNADGAAVDHTIRYGVYLSTDATITLSDRLIGYVETTDAPILTGTTQHFAGINVTIPVNVTSGSYYIGVYVDDQLEVSELDETNNWASVPITIDTPAVRAVSLSKTITSGDPYAAAGNVIAYSYQVTNTGNVALTGPASVADNKATVSCPAGNLALGQSITCTASYTITQADLDLGSVTNLATATMDGAVSSQATATATGTQARALSLSTAPTPTSYNAVGQSITYSYTVRNTGNVTLSGPFNVTDDHITGPIACGTGPLAPNATSTCTANYTTTQADLDGGSVTNHATVSNGSVTSLQAQATITATQTRTISLVKSITGGDPYAAVGASISYSYVVKNTGNVTLAGPVTVADNKTAVSCPAGGLAPGASITCTATYLVTQGDLDAGSVTNTATAAANDIPANQAQATAHASQSRSITLQKAVANGSPYTTVGAVISYSYVVRNTGNVTLAGPVTVADNKTTVTCPAGGLAPGAATTCTASYTVKQADLDAGSVTNTATATVNGINSTQAQATADATQTRAISLVKSITSGNPYTGAGNTIAYSYLVTNTGNVTLAGPVTVTDNKTTVTCSAGGLAPAASKTCTASYTVTQADLDAGSVTNSATAAANGVQSNTEVKTATATQTKTLSLAKSASASTYSTVGQPITYTYTVRNTGNVTLASPFSVTDNRIIGAITCGTLPLAPNATSTCTANYAVSQADLDAGSVTNTATVSNGPTTSAPVQVTISASQTRSISLGKVASTPTYSTVGQVIGYTYTIRNTGNVTLGGPFTVSDDKISGGIACGAAALAPNATSTCTANYAITQANLDGGSVTNHATAGNGTVSATAQVTVTANQSRTLSLAKTASPTTYNAVGQVITYTYAVRNTGNVTQSGALSITDDKLGTFTCVASALISPGNTASCTKPYSTVQADLNNRSVTNIATASLAGIVSGSATATVTSSLINGRIVGAKYYDGTRNGIKDAPSVGKPDPGVAGWRINITNNATNTTSTITTAADGSFTVLLNPGSYTVKESLATNGDWVQTGNTSSQVSVSGGLSAALSSGAYTVVVPSGTISDAAGLNFGNACSVIPGGQGLGYWAGKNGGNQITADDLAALRALHLVNEDGTPFDPVNVAQLQTWLNLSANGQNAADQLSGQIAALKLNLLHGLTKSNASVDGYRTTADEVLYADGLVQAAPLTPSGDPSRPEQSRVQVILGGVNSGQKFQQTIPDACAAPTWR